MKFDVRPIFEQRFVVEDGTNSKLTYTTLEDAVIDACRISVVSPRTTATVIREDLCLGKVYRRETLLNGKNITDYVKSLNPE